MPGEAVYLLFGVWALAILVVFIQAIRLSYRIEARSPDLTNRSGLPRNAMMFHTITNLSVARDEETQGLRRKMIRLLLIVVGGFLVLA
ncbi:MAG: hypothetical protein E5W60_24430, partial [Mesorhizobium sp.]